METSDSVDFDEVGRFNWYIHLCLNLLVLWVHFTWNKTEHLLYKKNTQSNYGLAPSQLSSCTTMFLRKPGFDNPVYLMIRFITRVVLQINQRRRWMKCTSLGVQEWKTLQFKIQPLDVAVSSSKSAKYYTFNLEGPPAWKALCSWDNGHLCCKPVKELFCPKY